MLSERRKSALALLAVLGSLSVFFYKTVFLGKPIAKLGLLPSLDAMFNPALRKAIIEFKDPSGYLIFFPNGIFEESMWSKFVIPLWNPLVACGYPLFGDPQSFLLSPAHLLRLFSSPELYNLGLILEITIGGVGMVLLTRFFNLSVGASILASLAFVLTPRILVQVDIGNNECFFPLIYLVFAWLAAKPGLIRAALAGLAAAVLAFSAHPEPVFFAVIFAAMISFFVMAFSNTDESKSSESNLLELARSASQALGLLMVSAVVSAAVASPVLFPFIEFMRCASFYKEDAGDGTSGTNLKEYMQGFYFGYGREPFFLGAVAALLYPMGAFTAYKRALPLLLTALFGFIICIPQGPIYEFLTHKPVNYVNTIYAIPSLLLVLSLLAGMGLDTILEKKQTRKKSLSLCAVLAISLLVSAGYPIYEQQRQMATHDFALLWKNARNALTATSVFSFIAALICFLPVKRSPYQALATVVLLCLNFASLAMMCRNILPVNPKFEMNPPAPLAFLREQNARILCTGTNFLLPNSNADFGLQDIRCFSPLLLTRYVKFIRACNAQVYNLYFYAFPDNCSKLLDLASVKYVCSRNGIKGFDDKMDPALKIEAAPGVRILPGFRISESTYSFDRENAQLDVHLKWKVHDNCNNRFSTQFVILDKHRKELWSSKEFISAPADSPEHFRDEITSLPIPQNAEFPASLCLRVKDTWISQPVAPDPQTKSIDHMFLLCEIPDLKAQSTVLKHFKLVKEFKEDACRVYANQRALPQAYLVFNAIHEKRNAEHLLAKLDSADFDPQTTVILEDSSSESDANQKNKLEKSKSVMTPVKLERKDCNTLELTCIAPEDGYLVQTDTFYPGWKCSVDGKETEIVQANYLFRAVRISKGSHQIKFVFAPASFYNTLAVSSIMTITILALAFASRKRVFSTCKNDNESETDSINTKPTDANSNPAEASTEPSNAKENTNANPGKTPES